MILFTEYQLLGLLYTDCVIFFNKKAMNNGERYIESQVYRAVIENIACEMAARMLAMRSATDNAAELITNLQLIYNKARQASITRELSEIVAGASVLE